MISIVTALCIDDEFEGQRFPMSDLFWNQIAFPLSSNTLVIFQGNFLILDLMIKTPLAPSHCVGKWNSVRQGGRRELKGETDFKKDRNQQESSKAKSGEMKQMKTNHLTEKSQLNPESFFSLDNLRFQWGIIFYMLKVSPTR